MEQPVPQQSAELRVPSLKSPSFFNREMAIGFAAGFPIPFPFTGTLGAIIGGVIGRSRMKKEFEQGKVVKPPSFFNSTAVLGGGFGTVGGLLVAGALALVYSTLPVWPIALAVGAGCALLGGFVGKGRMEKEYQAAQRYVAENGPYTPGMGRAPEQSAAIAPAHEKTVTPEEAKAISDRIAARQADAASRVSRTNMATSGLTR